jgi:hypothetical protein
VDAQELVWVDVYLVVQLDAMPLVIQPVLVNVLLIVQKVVIQVVLYLAIVVVQTQIEKELMRQHYDKKYTKL